MQKARHFYCRNEDTGLYRAYYWWKWMGIAKFVAKWLPPSLIFMKSSVKIAMANKSHVTANKSSVTANKSRVTANKHVLTANKDSVTANKTSFLANISGPMAISSCS